MCSLKQSENPYFVHIDHFSDLDEEFDALDELNEECAACGCEIGNCDCVENNNIEANTQRTVLGLVGSGVARLLYPVAKVGEGVVNTVDSVAQDSNIADRHKKDADTGKRTDERINQFIKDIKREKEGMHKLFNGFDKNNADEENVKTGGKGITSTWFANWRFTDRDRKHFLKDFQITNIKNAMLYTNVSQNELMVALAHAMFSSSAIKRTLWSDRKQTYRQAMVAEYKKIDNYAPKYQHILVRWYTRDQFDKHISEKDKEKVKHLYLKTHKDALRHNHIHKTVEKQKDDMTHKFNEKHGTKDNEQPAADSHWPHLHMPSFGLNHSHHGSYQSNSSHGSYQSNSSRGSLFPSVFRRNSHDSVVYAQPSHGWHVRRQ